MKDRGRWSYLYRAVDREGNRVDFRPIHVWFAQAGETSAGAGVPVDAASKARRRKERLVLTMDHVLAAYNHFWYDADRLIVKKSADDLLNLGNADPFYRCPFKLPASQVVPIQTGFASEPSTRRKTAI